MGQRSITHPTKFYSAIAFQLRSSNASNDASRLFASVVVSTFWQSCFLEGIGKKLTEKAIEAAYFNGFELPYATILSDNWAMLHLCKQLGFQICSVKGVRELVLNLNKSIPAFE